MDKKKRTFYLFCALQFTYWGCFAAFNAYFVALMLDAGMTSTRISLIQATYLMAAFAEHSLQGLCLGTGSRETVEDDTGVLFTETVID